MKKFSFNSIIRKQQPKGVFIEAIWKSWHRHLSISIVIGIAKKLVLPWEFFFKKSRIFMFFLVLSYGISTTLLQILSSLRFPIHQVKGVHWCSRKKLFEHSEASILVFQKNNCSKNFCILCILSSETSNFEFFLSTLVGLPRITPKSSLEQLFCRHGFIRAI